MRFEWFPIHRCALNYSTFVKLSRKSRGQPHHWFWILPYFCLRPIVYSQHFSGCPATLVVVSDAQNGPNARLDPSFGLSHPVVTTRAVCHATLGHGGTTLLILAMCVWAEVIDNSALQESLYTG